MTKSNWDYTSSRSAYHFDPKQIDPQGRWFWPVHKFNDTWQQELDTIINQQLSHPINWQTRKYTNNRTAESSMLDQEEYDITAAGGYAKMHLVNVVDDFANYPNLQNVINWFDLDRCVPRLHLQFCGQVWNQHIDKLDAVYSDVDPSCIKKYVVLLTNWQPGHYYNYGTSIYQNWQSGDAHEFDWANIPHGTANSSHSVRASLNIMGITKE